MYCGFSIVFDKQSSSSTSTCRRTMSLILHGLDSSALYKRRFQKLNSTISNSPPPEPSKILYKAPSLSTLQNLLTMFGGVSPQIKNTNDFNDESFEDLNK